MCRVLKQNVHESIQISLTNHPASLKLRQDLQPLEMIFEQMNQILSPLQQKSPTLEQGTLGPNKHVQAESQSNQAKLHAPSDQQKENNDNDAAMEDVEMKEATTEQKLDETIASATTEPKLEETIASATTEPKLEETIALSGEEPPHSADPVSPPKEPMCSPGTSEKDAQMVDTSNGTDTNTNAVSNENETTEKSDSGVIVFD